MKLSQPRRKEFWKPEYCKPEYWKQKYCRLINYRLKNRLDKVYNSRYYHHHHIKPKSIYGKNSYLVVLTKFEHCVAHWYLCQYFKLKKDKYSYNKMNLAFMSLYGQCGYKLGNVKDSRLFNQRKSILEKNISIILSDRLTAIHSTTKQLQAASSKEAYGRISHVS